jgi:YgiT-type zinc finger domain-containing protein
MQVSVTDSPFKHSDRSIVVVKNLPVLFCDNCTEYSLEDSVMAVVETILDAVDEAAELSVIKFAA